MAYTVTQQRAIALMIVSIICGAALIYLIFNNATMLANLKEMNVSGLVENFRGMTAKEMGVHIILLIGCVGSLMLSIMMFREPMMQALSAPPPFVTPVEGPVVADSGISGPVITATFTP